MPEQLLIDLALEAVELDDADVIVLAGAPLSGLATKVRDRLPVPLVDCAAAAVKMAEGLVGLRLRKATAGGFRHPGPRDSRGLDEHLARRLAFDPTGPMPGGSTP
jgi:Asp/Glu/hydantoin racemase